MQSGLFSGWFFPMLLDRVLAPVADAVKKKKKVTFFLGAGISTSCGIPDFRSPKTGLYANLQKLNLPYPEAVFDLDYFRDSPKAFYTLCEELYPGRYVPSKFHFLIRLFQEKKLLKRVYTQNIDTLERIAGVKGDFIVEAHGSFANSHCIDCDEPMPTEELTRQMFSNDDGIPKCARCTGYVKPDIVFFGEGLPERFFSMWEKESQDVELAVVAGTSLTVHPFASLPTECPKLLLRVLVNKDVVGDFATRKRRSDIIVQEECDHFAETLASLLGWREELEALWNEANEAEKNKTTKGITIPTDTTEKGLESKGQSGSVNVKTDEEKPDKKADDGETDLVDRIKKLDI